MFIGQCQQKLLICTRAAEGAPGGQMAQQASPLSTTVCVTLASIMLSALRLNGAGARAGNKLGPDPACARLPSLSYLQQDASMDPGNAR